MRVAIFSGRLGRDAELKAIPSGERVANFSLAVSTGTRDNPSTLWVDCSLFGKRAEALAPHLIKGTAITVAGDVGIRNWLGKAGDAAGTITCRVDRLTFGGKAGGAGHHSEQQAEAVPVTRSASEKAAPAVDFSDDIPF